MKKFKKLLEKEKTYHLDILLNGKIYNITLYYNKSALTGCVVHAQGNVLVGKEEAQQVSNLVGTYLGMKQFFEEMEYVVHYPYEQYEHAINCFKSVEEKKIFREERKKLNEVRQYCELVYEYLKQYIGFRSNVLVEMKKVEQHRAITQEKVAAIFGAIFQFEGLRKEEENLYLSLYPSFEGLHTFISATRNEENDEEAAFLLLFLSYLQQKKASYEAKLSFASYEIPVRNP